MERLKDIFIFSFIGGWVCSCALTLLLVINRISDILAPTISEFLFSNNRTWIVAMIPISYTLSVILFTPAIIFNSTVMAWIGDPMIFEGKSKEYYNPIQNLNNIVFITGTIVFYGAYCFFMAKKQMGYKVSSGRNVSVGKNRKIPIRRLTNNATSVHPIHFDLFYQLLFSSCILFDDVH